MAHVRRQKKYADSQLFEVAFAEGYCEVLHGERHQVWSPVLVNGPHRRVEIWVRLDYYSPPNSSFVAFVGYKNMRFGGLNVLL